MKKMYLTVLVLILFSGGADAQEQRAPSGPVPTFADAAVVLAKFSGLFDAYVEKDASLSECVRFFNLHGVDFNLMQVVNGSEFTILDCARVMGQIELLMSGEATYSMGKVILPKGLDSWSEFCTLNDVKFVQGYEHIVKGMIAIRQISN